MLDKTTARIAARMLHEYSEVLSNNNCNDYQLPATPANIEFVKAIIAAGDYPDDTPHIVRTYTAMGYVHDKDYSGSGAVLMDWQIVDYCIKQLEAYANDAPATHNAAPSTKEYGP